MIRAPKFRHYSARSAADAAAALAGEGPDAMLLAGGTDVVPNLKRRQHAPSILVSIRRAPDLHGISLNGELTLGASTSLSDIVRAHELRESHHALFRAAAQVATPLIRNSATIGGNLCLDTRCNYYNQSHEWRESIGYCMKAPNGVAEVGCAVPQLRGSAVETRSKTAEPRNHATAQPLPAPDDARCWVAPSSPRCWAVSSSDTAPALIALNAKIVLLSSRGEREIPLESLYADDGIRYLTKDCSEILTSIHVPNGWHSTYWKLRRRGSFDFPVLGVAAAIRFGAKGVVENARVVLGAVASRPLLLADSQTLAGQPLSDDVIEQFAERASVHAKPLDNTDFQMTWRKAVTKTFLTGVLRELRGDNPATFPLLMREAARPLSPTW